ncbi:rab-GTPase-TBC domain-containing protein [Gaertneriomyces semiglobifer]|nr:rab-GTPase-TBC domain-containing protein [Gaertneriomyces semiglobifer]
MKKGLSFSAYLQASFNAVRESVIGGASATTPTAEEEETDWEFWGRIISSPSTILKHPRLFTRHLHSGIPPPLRGTIWLLLSKGKDPSLEQVYATLLTRTSIHEKVIQRDLARTFPGVERFKEPGGAGQESLFNVVRAYTMYDTEVGYCQGVAFVVGVLLLNMPDEEAFCVLVRLMKDYKLRDFYTPQMVGLQLRLYQYDELLEEMFPNVARHLEQQEVRSTMYASQWFLTLFAYRFPLPVVYRILDILFFEGLDVLLRISLTLIKRNLAHILTLDFEPLLDFLQNGLFEVYSANPSQLIIDAMAMKISKTRLKHLEDRFEERRELEGEEYMKERELRIEMRRMRESVKRMETEYEMLNREHVQLANRVLEITVSAERDQETARVLKERVKELEENRLFERQRAEESVQVETDRLAMKNLELTRQNVELEEEKAGLESEVEVLRRRLDESEREKKELMVKLEGVRRAFG